MKRSPFRRPAQAGLIRAQDEAVELLLYDEIGFWGITAKQVAETLAEIDAGEIHLRINSPGGDVFDGVAIYNSLRQHSARIVTHIDGLAASISSVIALAGDEVRMAPNAFFMVHNPWGVTIGDAAVHRKTADTLDKIAGGAIASTYQAKTGAEIEDVERWMNEETWFSAAEAADVGFVDVVEEAAAVEARGPLPFDLSAYHHVPAGLDYVPAHDDPLEDISALRELEAALRDEGLTRKEAATALSGFKKWCRRDADTPSTPLRDEGRADPGADAALVAAEALLASLTVGNVNTRFAR
jgi:ATP-dependent Clp endopeptidase proteolytic subunit ClpP